jgi:glycosyltransferase involved in cell wall biosynthesis
MPSLTFFKDVTLLITHYNRSGSLERLLSTFEKQQVSFEEIIVSDDGSQPEHLSQVRKLEDKYKFRLITSPVNKGLANNLNKGQDAVKTPYTLYIQEDFVPLDIFATHFKDSLEIMNKRPELDIVRYYAYYAYPYLQYYDKGYSDMIIKPWSADYHKIYYYSDHPHLRRSSFLTKFGRYTEGIKGDRTEYRMCVSFIQNGGKGIFYNDYKSLFDQRNSADEPSTMSRVEWRQSENRLIGAVRYLYRQLRYNYDILFMKQENKG